MESDRSEKVAVPLTAVTGVVPDNVAPEGFAPIAIATLPPNPVAVLPKESRAATWTVIG